MNHNENRDLDMQPIVLFDRQFFKHSSCRFIARSLSALTFSLIALLTCVAATPADAADRFRGIRFVIQAEDDSLQTDDQGKGEFATLPKVQYLHARIQAVGFATEMLTVNPNT